MSTTPIESILTLITGNPGISRQEIFVELGEFDLSYNELTNCLTTLRRQGKIENRGTRKNPHWHSVEQNKGMSEPKSNDDLMEVFRRSEERLRRSLDHISRL